MRRNASSSAVPGLLLAVLVAALAWLVAPSAAAGPSATPLLGSAATSSAPAPQDEATVHRGAAMAHPLPVHQLPATVLTAAQRATSPPATAIRAGSGPTVGTGTEAAGRVQGRAPPATAR